MDVLEESARSRRSCGKWCSRLTLALLLFGAPIAACSSNEPKEDSETTAGSGGLSASGGNSADGSGGGDGASGGGPFGQGGSTLVSNVPRLEIEFAPTDDIFRNPERGFYRATSIIDEETLSWIDDEYSLYFSYVRLDDYRDTDLPNSVLTEVDAGLAKVRAEGAKLILRFAYNFGPYPDSEPDASLNQVLAHIEQLGPVLRNNSDVIVALQAGFIGAWGEWHTSTNGLDNIDDKTTVLEALLDELPVDRTVQVRYPPDLLDIYGDTPLAEEDAFSGSDHSRTAHHNDCFLASDTDLGTYPGGDAELLKTYLSGHNLFLPMGGETCAVNPPRSECATALEEMERLRFSYINDDYHPDVVQSWSDGGCRSEIERSLGYRLRLLSMDQPESVAPGDSFVLRLDIENVGWAAPINPRPAFLRIESETEGYRLEGAAVEVRSWLPGRTSAIEFRGTLPEGISPGQKTLSLDLPDAAGSLAGDPRYSIRLANDGTWQAQSGTNLLGTLTIDEQAPTDTVPGAIDVEPL